MVRAVIMRLTWLLASVIAYGCTERESPERDRAEQVDRRVEVSGLIVAQEGDGMTLRTLAGEQEVDWDTQPEVALSINGAELRHLRVAGDLG